MNFDLSPLASMYRRQTFNTFQLYKTNITPLTFVQVGERPSLDKCLLQGHLSIATNGSSSTT